MQKQVILSRQPCRHEKSVRLVLDTPDHPKTVSNKRSSKFCVIWLPYASENAIFAKNGWFLGFLYPMNYSSYEIGWCLNRTRKVGFLFKIFISNLLHPKNGWISHFCENWPIFRISISQELLIVWSWLAPQLNQNGQLAIQDSYIKHLTPYKIG